MNDHTYRVKRKSINKYSGFRRLCGVVEGGGGGGVVRGAVSSIEAYRLFFFFLCRFSIVIFP